MNEYTEREIELLAHIDALTAAMEDAILLLRDESIYFKPPAQDARQELERGLHKVWHSGEVQKMRNEMRDSD